MAYYNNWNKWNNPQQEEQRKSKYNDAFNQNLRLHDMWNECNKLSRNGQLTEWNWALDVIWRELSSDAIKDDFTTITTINKDIAKTKEDKNNLYQYLNDKEIFLRNLQNKQGKGSAYINPDDDDIEV